MYIGQQLSNPIIFFVANFIMVFAMGITRALSPFTSPFDEHTHLSYVQYAFNWIIPAEGYQMNDWAKLAFSCHPHAIYGPMTTVPCGEIGPGALYPTGGTNTSQTWPPVYFFLVALFMRLPLLFNNDPLIAARIVTALFWALGSAWLAVLAWKVSGSKVVGISISLLLAALPTFFYYNASVSPHALNPLIVATFLFISLKVISHIKGLNAEKETNFFKSAIGIYKSKWPILFIVFGILVAFTIFQAIAVVCFMALFICIWIFTFKANRLTAKFAYLLSVSIMTLATLFIFVTVFSFWQWQMHERRIPFPAGVNVAGANSDPADPIYVSGLVRVFARLWSFWPQVFDPGFPVGKDVSAVTGVWIFILSGLSLAAVVIWNKKNWLSPYMLALLIAAPLCSIAYDYFFTTDVPVRYGLSFSIIGLLGLANTKISPLPRKVIFLIAVLTYVSAYMLNPTYIEATSCMLDNNSSLIVCK